MRFIFILLSVLFFNTTITAQDIAIGAWKDHLSYKSGVSVTEGNGKVYCATKSGLFVYKKADNSMERLSKVNGISDVEATYVNFNSYNNKTIVIYKNSNIDLIDNSGAIVNISDIKRKNIVGNKSCL
ncbi:MAG: hypothetical protein IPH89_11750 [Bacteroidetes bacterium]|nr:hypothetical protein [Bacteroidota bacterium]